MLLLQNYAGPCFTSSQLPKAVPLQWMAGYVLHVDSDIVMIEHKSGAACKAVSHIYGTIMSRLAKCYKYVDAVRWDKPLPIQMDESDLGCARVNTAYVVRMQRSTPPLPITLLRHSGQSQLSVSNSKDSAAMKRPYLQVMVAILCWHFISAPVSALSLSSAPSGQRCTQLKTCNSLSGI